MIVQGQVSNFKKFPSTQSKISSLLWDRGLFLTPKPKETSRRTLDMCQTISWEERLLLSEVVLPSKIGHQDMLLRWLSNSMLLLWLFKRRFMRHLSIQGFHHSENSPGQEKGLILHWERNQDKASGLLKSQELDKESLCTVMALLPLCAQNLAPGPLSLQGVMLGSQVASYVTNLHLPRRIVDPQELLTRILNWAQCALIQSERALL